MKIANLHEILTEDLGIFLSLRVFLRRKVIFSWFRKGNSGFSFRKTVQVQPCLGATYFHRAHKAITYMLPPQVRFSSINVPLSAAIHARIATGHSLEKEIPPAVDYLDV
jgi:hypothetical protein